MEEVNSKRLKSHFGDLDQSIDSGIVVDSEDFDQLVKMSNGPAWPMEWLKDVVGKETIDL